MTETIGYVYYARIGRNIKIGYATDVKTRMTSYPPETDLLAVEPGSYELESARLAQFSDALVWGNEWFHPTTELKKHIADIRRVEGLPGAHMIHAYTPRNARPAPGRLAKIEAESGNWLTITEAAAELAVSTKTLRRYVTQGIVKANRVGPRLIRVDAKSLRAIGKSLQYVD